jgi:hypothetical protein
MALGPIGRNFEPRFKLAGTYDQDWFEGTFPFLPKDFDPVYHQAAPVDQQIPYPRGGEQIILVNLFPGASRFVFRLPELEIPVEFADRAMNRTLVQAVLDTILIEPDQRRLVLVWRASLPIKRTIHEIAEILVGKMSRAWYISRETGKEYFHSIGAYVQSKRAARQEIETSDDHELDELEDEFDEEDEEV